MIEVKLLDKMPNEISEIVRDIKQMGYNIGKDFDFAYYKPKYDNFSSDPVYNRYTIFTFYKDELATWFELRYK